VSHRDGRWLLLLLLLLGRRLRGYVTTAPACVRRRWAKRVPRLRMPPNARLRRERRRRCVPRCILGLGQQGRRRRGFVAQLLREYSDDARRCCCGNRGLGAVGAAAPAAERQWDTGRVVFVFVFLL
jgi:hypothetical protein